jgi:2-aminoadipate transaminase
MIITDGCQQAIDLVGRLFLRPGDAVALENPAYPGAVSAYAGARVRVLGVPVDAGPDKFGINLDALESVLMQNRVKFVLVTPDFQNPTGSTLPLAERRRLLEIASRYQVPVIEDAIYSRLRLRGTRAPSLKSLDREGNVIQIDSFS